MITKTMIRENQYAALLVALQRRSSIEGCDGVVVVDQALARRAPFGSRYSAQQPLPF